MSAPLPPRDSRFTGLSTAFLTWLLVQLASGDPGSPDRVYAQIRLGCCGVTADDVRAELRIRERFGAARATPPTVVVHWDGPLGLPVSWLGQIEAEGDEWVRLRVERSRVGPGGDWEPCSGVFTTQRWRVQAVEPAR